MKISGSLKYLLTSAAGIAIIASVNAHAADIVIQDGETETNDLDLGGTDSLTIEEGGALSVDGEAIEWDGPSTALVIINSGTIESTRADTRAFDTAGSETAPRALSIINTSTGIIQSEADAIRINVDITDGSVLIDNAGLIVSTLGGQALDFDAINSTPEFQVQIYNRADGEIRSTNADAIRPGENALVDNSGLIFAASGASISSDAVDLQGHFATVINRTDGVISGARHGITTDNDLYVVNEVGGLILGRNGSGVGSDGFGTVINYGTIRGTIDTSYPFGDGDGIDIDEAGYVENFGVIEALGAFGVRPDGRGVGSDGVTFGAPGGTLINHAGARIYSVTTAVAFARQVTVINEGWIEGGYSGIGVEFTGDDLIINSGTVIGGPGYGILLSGGNDTLIIRRGSRIVGTVIGGDDTDLLRLEDGAVFETSTEFETLEVSGAAELTGDNTFETASIETNSTLTVAATAELDVMASGLQLLGPGSALINRGAILGSVLGSASDDTVTNSGSITAPVTAVSLLGGNDRLVLQAGSTLAGLVDGGTGTDTLALDSLSLPQAYTGFELLDVSGNVLVSSNAVFQGTTINPLAQLTLGNGGTTGGVGGNITNNGTLVLDRSDAVLFDAAMAGTGNFIQAGSGSARLTSNNTYTGSTTVQGGTLIIGNGATTGSVAGPIINNAALVSDRSDTVVFNGRISGTGSFTQSGSGTVRLTGANSYTGATRVAAGTLVLDGVLDSAVSVNAGRFTGVGQVRSLAVASGATTSFGGTIATLATMGNLVLAAGSITEMRLAAGGTSDLFDVGGTASLGGSLQLAPQGSGYAPRTEYTLVAADGGVSGTFATVAIPSATYSYLAPQLVYSPNALRLILRRTDIDFAASAQNRDQITVANVIEALPLTNALRDQVLVLTAAQAPLAYESLAGEIHGSTASMIIENDLRLRDRMLASVDTTLEGAGLWAQVFGSAGDFSDNDAARTDTELKGIAGGVTYGFGPLSLGFGGGISQSEAEATGGLGLSDVDTSFVGGQAQLDLPLVEARVGLTYSSHDVDTTRTATVGTASYTLSSKHSMHSVLGYADAAFTLVNGAIFAIKPVAGYSFVSLGGEDFVEAGGIAALSGDASDRKVQLASVGLRFEATAGVPFLGGISPRVEARWQHAWGDRAGTIAAQFQTGGTAFSVAGHGVDKEQLLLDAGITAELGPVNLGLSYLGSIGTDYSQHGGQVSLGFAF